MFNHACMQEHQEQQRATTCEIVLSILTPFVFNEKLQSRIPGIHSKLD